MPSVNRHSKLVAQPGRGSELAERMLAVAEGLRETPGCWLYVVARVPGEPDTLWVTELWRSEEDIQAALEGDEAREAMAPVLELLDRERSEHRDLEPLGGVGMPAPAGRHAIVSLGELEDMAARFGFGEQGEARFARTALGAQTTGLSLQHLRPGARQAFGHRHHLDEEIYVVLEGEGTVAVEEEIHPIRALDAILVGPRAARAFEAGPAGLTLLATGAHHAGDAEILPGFWPGQRGERAG